MLQPPSYGAASDFYSPHHHHPGLGHGHPGHHGGHHPGVPTPAPDGSPRTGKLTGLTSADFYGPDPGFLGFGPHQVNISFHSVFFGKFLEADLNWFCKNDLLFRAHLIRSDRACIIQTNLWCPSKYELSLFFAQCCWRNLQHTHNSKNWVLETRW